MDAEEPRSVTIEGVEPLVVVGSLAGIVLGWVLSQWAERGRWQREDRNRFATTRRELYARFLIEATVIFDEIRSAAYAAQRAPTVSKGAVPREVADVLIGAHKKLRQSEMELKLVAGNPELLRAAAELRDITGFASGFLADQPDPHQPDGPWARLETRWEAASVAFVKSARSDLRVT